MTVTHSSAWLYSPESAASSVCARFRLDFLLWLLSFSRGEDLQELDGCNTGLELEADYSP